MFDKCQGKRAIEWGKPCGKTAGHSIRGDGSYEGRGGALWRGEEGRGGAQRGEAVGMRGQAGERKHDGAGLYL